MFSHIHIGITDFPRAFAFYAAVMAELGLELRVQEPDQGWAGWGRVDAERPIFFIGRPFDGGMAVPGNGCMVALLAANRALVDRCHTRAMSAGGSDEGTPGLRPHYHPDYYGAYFRDPDGNKLCVVCHDGENDAASTGST